MAKYNMFIRLNFNFFKVKLKVRSKNIEVKLNV